MIEWWDDANQLVSRALLSDGVGAAWWDRFRPCTVITLVVGFRATTAVLWEIVEYPAPGFSERKRWNSLMFFSLNRAC